MIPSLLSQLGSGIMDSVPYDTAWLARLSIKYPEFSPAVDWLRARQLHDGSWGSPAVYYRDRFVSTLSAVLALYDLGLAEDQPRIERGLAYMWRKYPHIRSDAHDTVAYAVLMTTMLNEAAARNLHVPQYLAHNPQEVRAKLQLLAGASQGWRHRTMSFSLEIWLDQITGELDFLESNGSSGISPAATAALLTRFDHADAYQYIQGVATKQGDGGLPNCDPIDIFETSWSLNYLRMAGAIEPNDPVVQQKLALLEHNWNAQRGSTYSTYFSVHDLDITCTVFTLLTWSGRTVDPAPFAYFELENSFRTYAHETHSSLTVHLNLLITLQNAGYDRNHPWIAKALGQIQRWKETGEVWFDKWHISPYYLTLVLEEALIELDEAFVAERIQWLLATQRADGGWGYYHMSTAEETAYALLTLLRWSQRNEGVPVEVIQRGAAHLDSVAEHDVYPALYIGKCLYTPRLIVQSLVASAQHLYHVMLPHASDGRSLAAR